MEFDNFNIYIQEILQGQEKSDSIFDVFVLLSTNYYNNKKKLLFIRNSPVSPNQMTELLDDFILTVHKNFDIATKILNQYNLELKKILEGKQYTKDDLVHLAYHFSRKMEKDYIAEYVKLEPKVIAIINYVRSYFKPDKLFD